MVASYPTAVAQAIDVFPTPPFPVKNKYLVSSISDKLNAFIILITNLFNDYLMGIKSKLIPVHSLICLVVG